MVATFSTASRVPRSLTPPLTWSGWRDSNPRPLAPKASALPSCATPRAPSRSAYATTWIPRRPPLASREGASTRYAWAAPPPRSMRA